MTPIRERKRAHFYMYKKQKELRNEYTVRMNEMPRFFIIRKYDWFISQRTSQIQIRSKSF